MLRNKIYLSILLGAVLIASKIHGQDSIAISQSRQARAYYQQGQKYRTGDEVAMDYAQAVEYYKKAAQLGDAHGEYALGYMYYKGLGCDQDYYKAAGLFHKGALAGLDNSTYFYALCLRNGYGVNTNKDSATYWLKYADSLGSHQAKLELAAISAENRTDSAKQLLENIHNSALPEQGKINSFVKIVNKVPATEVIAGRYKGYLIQYDWSGKNVIDTKEMVLDIKASNGGISGSWVEQQTDSFYFSATMGSDSLIFDPVSYGRKDHYSPDSAISYTLNNAALTLVQSMEAVCLAGNVTMFSADRKEPGKPVVLALSRNAKEEIPDIQLTETKLFPNPFHNSLEIQFTLGKKAKVAITMTSISGQQVYTHPVQELSTGRYDFRLQPSVTLAPGTYFVNVFVNGKPHGFKVVKM